jgi:hypothetical protein
MILSELKATLVGLKDYGYLKIVRVKDCAV